MEYIPGRNNKADPLSRTVIVAALSNESDEVKEITPEEQDSDRMIMEWRNFINNGDIPEQADRSWLSIADRCYEDEYGYLRYVDSRGGKRIIVPESAKQRVLKFIQLQN